MDENSQEERLRRPGRTALLILTVVVVTVPGIGYLLADAIIANGEYAAERCFSPPPGTIPPSEPSESGTKIDYEGHLFTLTVTCYYETPSGNHYQAEVSLVENLDLF